MLDQTIIFSAKYLLYIIALIALAGFYLLNKKERMEFVKLSVISAPLAFVLARISSVFISDPRPFVVENVTPLIAHAADNGFPSDHTLAGMMIALVILKFNKKMGIVLVMLSLIIGLARILAKVHHPIDILGSVLIDLISLWATLIILRKTSSKTP